MTHLPPPPAPTPGEIQQLRNRAVLLTVLGFLCGGTVPGILGVIALTQIDTAPDSARQLVRVGWIVFWVLVAALVLFFVVYIGFSVLVLGVALVPLLGSI